MIDFIAEIVETEDELYSNANQRFPQWLPLTKKCLDHLNSVIGSIGTSQHHAAALWFSAQRHYAKSALSIIRCHQSQSAFNLRQGIENTVLAAFMLDNPEFDPTIDPNATDEDDNFLAPKKLQGMAHKWLNRSFPSESKELREIKELVNEAFLHGSVYLTHHSFEWKTSEDFKGFLFDRIPNEVISIFFLQLCQSMIVSARLIRRAAAMKTGFILVPDAEVREHGLIDKCIALRRGMKPPTLDMI